MKRELRSAFNSRQYMLTRDFEIYYYSDLHFHAVKGHAHDYYEFYLFLEGNVTMIIGGKKYPLHAGDMILIPPGVSHHALIPDSEIPYRRFIFWLSQDYVTSLMTQSPDYVYLMQQAASTQRYLYHFNGEQFNSVQNRVLKLLEETHSNRYGKSAAMSLDVNDLVLSINRIVYEKEHPDTAEDPDILQDVSMYIENHLEDALTLDSLAEQYYVSKYYISHLFTETYGISLHQYIMKKRLAACRNAILMGGQPSRVFYEYGIHDYSSFFRAFKKEYGMSPKDYQNVYLKDPQRSNHPSSHQKQENGV